ncbi:MAG: hypothetical protein Q7R96_01305 [Nanoarchaeota archaeon]|nr:hypothetical protein [Nanoarchaeota archaeon]
MNIRLLTPQQLFGIEEYHLTLLTPLQLQRKEATCEGERTRLTDAKRFYHYVRIFKQGGFKGSTPYLFPAVAVPAILPSAQRQRSWLTYHASEENLNSNLQYRDQPLIREFNTLVRDAFKRIPKNKEAYFLLDGHTKSTAAALHGSLLPTFCLRDEVDYIECLTAAESGALDEFAPLHSGDSYPITVERLDMITDLEGLLKEVREHIYSHWLNRANDVAFYTAEERAKKLRVTLEEDGQHIPELLLPK